MKEYKAKGDIYFRLGENGIEYQIYDRDWYLKQESRYFSDPTACEVIVNQKFRWNFTKGIYDLFDGKNFLENVLDGCIMDYDGSISDIFVDGYVSNLGLATDNLTQGKFLVSAEVWSDICDEFKVEVNWANK